MIVAWTRVEEYEQISAVFSSMHTLPSQLLFEESLSDHWMVHVNSHKLRRVNFKRTPAVTVIQNLFCSFLSEASIPILGVTQELFVAAGALRSIPSTSWPRPDSTARCSTLSVLRQFLGDCQENVVHVQRCL